MIAGVIPSAHRERVRLFLWRVGIGLGLLLLWEGAAGRWMVQ